MRTKSYVHYLWQPFANFELHFILFDYGKCRTSTVWNRVFGVGEKLSNPSINYGRTYFDKNLNVTKYAISLMKHKDGSVDIMDITHEVTHVCDVIFQTCDMKFGIENGCNEFRSYLSGSIVSKICQICTANKVKITFDKSDKLGLNEVIKLN